jgi:hypothetical protein
MSETPPLLHVDLTVFGADADVIDTRVPRSLFGRLRLGDSVSVGDGDVTTGLYRVVELTNGERDVRLLNIGPTSIEAKIAAKIAATDFAGDFARADITTVALDDAGRIVEHRPDGSTFALTPRPPADMPVCDPGKDGSSVDLADERRRRNDAVHVQLLQSGTVGLRSLSGLRGDLVLAVTIAWVQEQAHSLLSVRHAGEMRYPTFQLTSDGQLRPELARHLRTLRHAGLGAWQTWAWMTTPTALLSGDVPVDVVVTNPGRVDLAVKRLTARLAEQSS